MIKLHDELFWSMPNYLYHGFVDLYLTVYLDGDLWIGDAYLENYFTFGGKGD